MAYQREETQQPTKFNMAIATLESMHELLKQINLYSTTGDLIRWSELLMTLRRSISSFITTDEFKDIEDKFKILNNVKWIHRLKSNELKVMPSQISRVYNLLDDLTIYIQRVMNKAGLLMPKSDDPRYALED